MPSLVYLPLWLARSPLISYCPVYLELRVVWKRKETVYEMGGVWQTLTLQCILHVLSKQMPHHFCTDFSYIQLLRKPERWKNTVNIKARAI